MPNFPDHADPDRGGALGLIGSAELEQDEIQIGDRIYKLSKEFIYKHPGGTIIKSKLGTNATQAYYQFHIRSLDKANRWLEKLPSRPGFKQLSLLDDFDQLTKQLEEEGFFKPSIPHIIYRFVDIIVLVLVGYYLVRMDWYWTGMLLLGIAAGRCGWLQHEANHNSLTCIPWLDKIIGSAYFAIGEGGSATWWISAHNRHHAAPQHLGFDPDLNTLPVLAYNPAIARMGDPKLIRWQVWTFQPGIWYVIINWLFYLHPKTIIKKRAYMDGFFLILHYVIWFKIFSFMPVWKIIFTHVVWGCVQGSYLFTHFALSHTHRPVLMPEEREDWVRSAILRTTNVRDHWLVNWVMGYLNFQIEHHLFPCMPQFRHPEVSKRVKELCKKHGLEYDETGYFDCFYRTFKNLDAVAHHPDVGKDRYKLKIKKGE